MNTGGLKIKTVFSSKVCNIVFLKVNIFSFIIHVISSPRSQNVERM